MKCNFNQACQWEGAIGALETHAATCKFTLVPCPKECIDDDTNEIAQIQRKELDEHLKQNCPLRDHRCKFCGANGTYACITEAHDRICKKKIVPCPNNCTKTMPRQDIERHVSHECEHTVMACKFKNAGCKAEMKRGDITAHEMDDSLHLGIALTTIGGLQDHVIRLQRTASKLQGIVVELQDSQRETLKKGKFAVLKIADFENKKSSNVKFACPSFYISPGYQMAIHVYPNGTGSGEGTHVSVTIEMLRGKHDSTLQWPFIGKVTITMLNQLQDTNHILFTDSSYEASAGEAWDYEEFTSHSALGHDPNRNVQYLKNDALYFRVSVDVQDCRPWLE